MQDSTYSSEILQYIPFFYVIWSDDLLTTSEIDVVQNAIDADNSLSERSRAQLLTWLNTNNPPANSELKKWKRTISNSSVKLTESETYPLTSFSQKIVCHYKKECPFNDQLKHIEIQLGIQPNHYNHLFDVEVVHKSTSDFYSADAIDTILKGKHATVVDSFRKTLADPIFKWEVHRNKEKFRETVLKQVKFLADKGYGAMAYPEAYGGTDDMEGYAYMFENMMFADGSLSIKFGVQFGLFGGSIQKLGTKKHHDQYLTKTGKTELLGCFAMTETGHGSNVRGIKTTATYNKATDEIVIHTPGKNDNKEYIGNALHSKMATVFAQLIVNGKNEGVHAILVPLRNKEHELLPGVTVEDNGYKLGLNGVDNGKIWFDQVAVPRENLLNRYGDIKEDGSYYSEIKNPNKRFFTMLGTLVGGRICVARAGLGGAKFALAVAIKHALKRRQFNDSVKIQEDLLMDYPSHQLRLTPLVASAYVYHVTLDKMMQLYCDPSEPDKRKVETQVAGLKSIITWYANDSIQECREACGGKGYLLENRIADLKGDVDIFTTFEGDNTVLLLLAAKGVLSDFKSEFNSAGFSAVLKILGMQINDKLTTINPIYSNKVDKDHLYNPKFHKHALEYRTRRLTYTLAMRIRDYIKQGVPSYQAFLKVQTHLLALGKAYSNELAYNTFIDFIQDIEDDKNRTLFQKLGTLHALHTIRQDAEWYLEQGYIGGTKSKAIRQRVERLCTELRPHIGVLVDGFGIPEHCMTAPITQ
ncbi:acyl-CoA dehydrogenase family protein [Zobellia galactanivorans]|uniref:acyl-CoA oxidase n=1 Tax=Zobellia galactanivorans (strain DSM 12802 / CCUG 47099 / CIP 106680 / NCIMB 13871 / Dsij) TaxID=63186 RepID=G0L5U0_ZOBGA|nr:acyl-CoA dehydrogenase [Zobellia galactanivorans]MBU3027844.1 acyl-CoA dehydrogenase family protein [Zobellia galactanivorans]CAZ96523.1 Acyl-coenzyme A oxidase [Zobellia galactanivorans]